MKRALGILLFACSACGAIDEPQDKLVIDRFSELLIVDEEALAPTPGAPSAPPQFAALVRALFQGDSERALSAWLADWQVASDHPAGFFEIVTCPWLRATKDNVCNADCSQCAARELSLEHAPLRLIAVAYRPDLALASSDSPRGQLRLVFAVTRGPARLAESEELAITLIFEYPLPARLRARDWAERFHALSAARKDLAAFRAMLFSLSASGSEVDRREDVSLRVRDDVLSDGRMLAWAPRAARLARIPLENTVHSDELSSRALAAELTGASAELSSQELRVPAHFWADSVTRESGFPALSNAALSANLRLISCHGCHADAHSQHGFHIAPGKVGRARVSRFLHDPEHADSDELARRADGLRSLLAR